MATRGKKETEKRRRKRSATGGARFRLDAPKVEGMHRRWVNDDGQGSLERAQENDYEFVTRDNESDDQRTSTQDTRIARHVGGGRKAYLMQMPQEWRDEDQAAAQARIDAKEDGIFRRKEIPAGTGNTLSDDPTGYVKQATIRRGS